MSRKLDGKFCLRLQNFATFYPIKLYYAELTKTTSKYLQNILGKSSDSPKKVFLK